MVDLIQIAWNWLQNNYGWFIFWVIIATILLMIFSAFINADEMPADYDDECKWIDKFDKK